MALNPGKSAPEFTLPTKNAEGLQQVSLSAHRGKENVVLLFFPLAFTSVCMQEMCTMRDSLGQYTSLNAKVYGISVDSPFALEVMANSENINFPLLSDFNREVCAAYDVMYEDLIGLKGVAKRSAFVINKAGEIVYSWSSDDPHNLPDFSALQAALSA